MGIFREIGAVGRILFRHPVKSFVTGAKGIIGFKLKAPPGQRIIGDAVPFGPTSGVMAIRGAGAVARGIGGVVRGGVNIIKRQFTNPFAGVSVKEGLKTLGKRIGGYGLTGAGFGIAYTSSKGLITGETPNVGTILKGGAHGLAAGANPIGALFGTGAGIVQKYGGEGMSIAERKFPDLPKYEPPEWFNNLPTVPDFSFTAPNITYPNITYPQVSMVGPTYSMPSPPDYSPLLLALLGGGALGYALGRRRKKKKRYKKRKRR